MRKKLVVFLLIILMTGSMFYGCPGTSQKSEQPAETKPEKIIILTI